MKKLSVCILFCSLIGLVRAQENAITLSGGYAFANIEDVESNATGWRINGLYEFNPLEGNLAHGLSFGYIGTSTTNTSLLLTSEYKINSWPIYYAPKFMFGNDKFKGFLKGALGMHFTNFKRTGALGDLSTSDAGFYGGASAGLKFMLGEKLFINAEYEWAYMSNTYYRDGFMNSILGGIGMKF